MFRDTRINEVVNVKFILARHFATLDTDGLNANLAFAARHHVYEKPAGVKSIELKEVGPRFELRLYQVFTLTPVNMVYLSWLRNNCIIFCYMLKKFNFRVCLV